MKRGGLRRTLAATGFFIGLSALIVQFLITMTASMDAGRSLGGSLVFYFSYFTILSNALLVLVYLGATVRGQRWLAFFRKPHTRAVGAAAITLVMLYYTIFLAHLWEPSGAAFVTDIVLHYVAPILYLVWFAGWNRSGTLQWSAVLTMLPYAVIYLGYVLVRGALTGEVPYPTLDVAEAGMESVALTLAGMLAAAAVLCLGAISIDRSVLIGK